MGDQGITILTDSGLDLLAGQSELLVEKPVTIVSGAGVLTKGTVLGRVTASKKYDAYADAGAGGLDVARSVLTEDVDATSADVVTTAWFAGVFNDAAITGITDAAREDFVWGPLFVKTIG